jgi:excisionase family DNA binding protein
MEKLLYTTAEAAALLGLCRNKVYELMYAGTLKSVKIGRSRRIPADALRACVATLREST